jgi:hypothetical protein
MVMIGGELGEQLLYDVSDPVHPRLVCAIQNTSTRLFTGDTFEYLKTVSATETDVILHSIGSGNESVVAKVPAAIGLGTIAPDGTTVAYTVSVQDANGVQATQVWIAAGGEKRLVYTYTDGIGDCICRFGLPPQLLGFSPDGQYIVAGWPVGKGSVPLAVLRVADGARVYIGDPGVAQAVWDHAGHRMYVDGDNVVAWTPESGLAAVTPSGWSYYPNLSPDGTAAAYTAYAGTSFTQVRVFTYDFRAKKAQMLTSALRSQVLFVKDGWVWYLEEVECAPADGCPSATRPGNKVFAMNLANHVEVPVVFAAGEAPLEQMNSFDFATPQFWPNS